MTAATALRQAGINSIGQMAFDAKNRGMVNTWPVPMNAHAT